MPIKFACPKCHRKLGVAERLAGKKGRCPRCRAVVFVPPQSQDLTPSKYPELRPDQTHYGIELEEEAAPAEDSKGATPSALPAVRTAVKRGQKYELLIRDGILTATQLDEASARARETGRTIENVLELDCLVKREDLGRALSSYYRFSLFRYEPTIEVPRDLVSQLTPEYLREQGWCPVSRKGESVVVAIQDPSNLMKHDDIRERIGCSKLVLQVALADDLVRLVERAYRKQSSETVSAGEVQTIIEELKEDVEVEEEEVEDVVGHEELNENDGVIVRLVNKLVMDANAQGASDIHIEPNGNRPINVRYRIDGDCQQRSTIPGSYKRAVVSRIKVMAGLDIAEHRRPQDGKIRFRPKGQHEVDLRICTYPTLGGSEDVVIRILANPSPLPVTDLLLSESNRERLQVLIKKSYGLILAVGPTGSGKTTTLHSLMATINTADMKILTAEDPVEITHPGLRQLQVHPKIGLTFASAMRSFLRADPDVIMIGEMRDQETAETAVEASLTGHLVLSTLHTNNAPETVTRLLDMGLDSFTFADSLLGVLAQRLVRRLCTECRVPQSWQEGGGDSLIQAFGEKEWGELGIKSPKDVVLYRRGPGCGACRDIGYKGRLAIHELLVSGDEVRDAIQRKSAAEVIRSIAIRGGMRTLRQDGIEKIVQGLTDLDQVLAAANR